MKALNQKHQKITAVKGRHIEKNISHAINNNKPLTDLDISLSGKHTCDVIQELIHLYFKLDIKTLYFVTLENETGIFISIINRKKF